jgi:hypothetical protein
MPRNWIAYTQDSFRIRLFLPILDTFHSYPPTPLQWPVRLPTGEPTKASSSSALGCVAVVMRDNIVQREHHRQ